MKLTAKTLLALTLSAGVCVAASKPDTAKTHPAKQTNPKAQIGPASWYGKAFHGRPTASGESYDMFQFTAAHKTLPLGTIVKVTNLRNGKWVVCRVNDRGPYVGNRIIDVSYGAAQMLSFRARGVEKVKIEILEEPATETIAMVGSSALD